MQWIHNILRLANARHDREFLRRICVSWQQFTGVVLEVNDIEAIASLAGGDYLRAWVDAAIENNNNSVPIQEMLSRVKNDIVERLMFIELLEWYWKQNWIDDELEAEENIMWKEMHNGVIREHSPENITLYLYLQELEMRSKVTPRQAGSIPCLTVHGAKGLEFKHVFLIGMAEEVFPSYHAVKKGNDSDEMEEERRSCFVGITRVQETLHISWAHRYNGFPKRPSRFIEEMGFRLTK